MLTVSCVIITPVPETTCVSADIVYMVTGGSSLRQAYRVFGGTQSFGLSAWIVVFAATELLSCQVGLLHRIVTSANTSYQPMPCSYLSGWHHTV